MAIVLIAEDEYLVRVGLRTCLDWERHGFILLDDAVNGEDAYQKILRHRPDILLLDEPTASLDHTSKQKVRDLIEQLKLEGTTMLGIFHDLEFMEGLCDREYNMQKGMMA